jgi:hypothetical protein
MEQFLEPIELNDAELAAVAGGAFNNSSNFLNNSFNNFLNGSGNTNITNTFTNFGNNATNSDFF